ncbi:MAG: hypothetical protein JF588_19320 [Caulobacterales bacterium]|nr:hypothetical protein [Caulobacterales bacterium]
MTALVDQASTDRARLIVSRIRAGALPVVEVVETKLGLFVAFGVEGLTLGYTSDGARGFADTVSARELNPELPALLRRAALVCDNLKGSAQ